nr:RHS repeat-associated core domain-containing protein [Sulfuricella sp. T08]
MVFGVTDAKNQTTSYTWDTGHQLISRTEQGGRLTTYTRNALGQVIQTVHPEAITTYGYDNSHRLTSVIDSRGLKNLSYSWSPGGLLNRLTDSDGRITNYLYDPVGRLAGVTAPNNDTVTYRFDAGGRLTERWLANNASARYAYNADNSLKQLVNRNTASTILTQHDYTYDGVGNRASQTENIGGSTLNYAYSYDELSRLTQITNGTAAQQENDSYDPWNNRTLKSIGNPATSTLAYKYDDANQLTEIHNGTITGTLLSTLSYDNNGNLQSDGSRSYTWDALNQLAQVTKGATTVAYGYDADGRRIRKVTGGITTQWLYDGQDIYAEYGAAWTNPNAVYTSGGGVDDPVIKATVTGASSYGQAQYYHADGLGSIVGLSNSTDTTTQTERFDAWGNKLAGTIPQAAQYGFTGREPDETGLTFYRARFYDPSIGRFVSRDPIGLSGGINQYAYVNNSPVMFTDPWGLKAVSPLSMMLADAGKNYFSNTVTDVGNTLSSGYQSLSTSVKESWDTSPAVATGKAFGGLVAAAQGVITGDQTLVDTAIQGMAENKQGSVDALLLLGTMGRGGAKAGVQEGTQVFRVWGDGANAWGRSWTTVDPRTVQNYRDTAGLPNQNSGRFLSEGVLKDTSGVTLKAADPLHGNIGGLPEVVIPNPQSQIKLQNVQGINPKF